MSTERQLAVSALETVLPASQSRPTRALQNGQTSVSVTVAVPEGNGTVGVVVASLHPQQVTRAIKNMRACFMGSIAPVRILNRAAPLAYNVWRGHAVPRPDLHNDRVPIMNDAYQLMGGPRHGARTIT